jgi:hypothetical protein
MIDTTNIYQMSIRAVIKKVYKKTVKIEDVERFNYDNSTISLIIKAIDKGINKKKVSVGLIRRQLKKYPKQLNIIDRLRG